MKFPAQVCQIFNPLTANLILCIIDSEAELFRGNSTTTRFLSAFSKIHGYNYLRSLILPLVQSMASMPPGHGYELDPNKAAGQDVEQNQKNVQLVVSGFLSVITSSVSTIPPSVLYPCAISTVAQLQYSGCSAISARILRNQCTLVFNHLCHLFTRISRQEVWPEAKFAALGAFIFLRCDNPRFLIVFRATHSIS